MPFDENLKPEIQSVLNAAALLDITEYDLFQLAYARWHGKSASVRVLEPYFVAYMFNEVVPLWVRHFSRLVERLSSAGQLDRRALGVTRLPRTQEMVRRGVRFAVAIVTVMGVLIVFAEFAARILKLGERCFFPPCY